MHIVQQNETIYDNKEGRTTIFKCMLRLSRKLMGIHRRLQTRKLAEENLRKAYKRVSLTMLQYNATFSLILDNYWNIR